MQLRNWISLINYFLQGKETTSWIKQTNKQKALKLCNFMTQSCNYLSYFLKMLTVSLTSRKCIDRASMSINGSTKHISRETLKEYNFFKICLVPLIDFLVGSDINWLLKLYTYKTWFLFFFLKLYLWEIRHYLKNLFRFHFSVSKDFCTGVIYNIAIGKQTLLILFDNPTNPTFRIF